MDGNDLGEGWHAGQGIIQSLFSSLYAINHHLAAPLFTQRAMYLQHLASAGQRRATLKDTAALLLHVIRVLRLHEQRLVNDSEIREAASAWSEEELRHRRPPLRKSALRFYTVANGFLKYHGLKARTDPFSSCFDPIMIEFEGFLVAKGYRLTTMKAIGPPVRSFLFWLSKRKTHLPSLCATDIDAYLSEGVCSLGWQSRTVIGKCQAIRTFLRFSESHGVSKPGLAQAIVNPVVKSREYAVSGPPWDDVRRMLQKTGNASAEESRAKAILLLCCVYGLRSSEITRLTLDSFDWKDESFALQRSKNGWWQRFPITRELRTAILDYVHHYRAVSACRVLFLTLLPPYRSPQNLGPIVRKQMQLASIEPKGFGPHSLRHSCATELLRRGTSLQNIALLLGHRDLRSVSVYARHDVNTLRRIADFNLSAVL